MSWVLVYLLAFLSQLLCSTAKDYYVVPRNVSENNDSSCHPLNYYAENSSEYFVTDSTFIFLPGVHVLESNISVKNVFRIVLRNHTTAGQSVCGDHVKKQSAVINCMGNEAGFAFSNVTDLTIQGINITECGLILYSITYNDSNVISTHYWSASLALLDVINFSLVEVYISNSHGYGVFGQGVYGNSSMENCHFHANSGRQQPNITHGGNIGLRYNESCYHNTSYFYIRDSVISDGYSVSYAGGLDLILNCHSGGIHLILHQVHLINNSGFQIGANFAMQLLAFSYQADMNTVKLIECTIQDTTSHDSAMYMDIYINSTLLGKYQENGTVTAVEIDNTRFFNNTSKLGSTMHMRLFYAAEHSNKQVKIAFKNTHFESNKLQSEKREQSGGLAVNIVVFKVVESELHSAPQFKTSFTNCTFANNSIIKPQNFVSGIIYIEEHSNVILENCSICNNNGTGITAVHSYIRFIGNNTIEGNSAMWGGGLVLHDRAVMLLTENTTLTIRNNSATRLGGAIYAEIETTSAIPLCFYQFDTEVLLSKIKLKTIHVNLENNNATTGTAVYGGDIDECYFLVDNTPWRNKYLLSQKSRNIFDLIFKYKNTSTAISSDPIRVCLCENSSAQCNKTAKIVSISPGESFKINATVVGQRDGSASGIIIAQFSNTVNKKVHLGPNEDTQKVYLDCNTLSYSVYSYKENIQVVLSLYVSRSSYSLSYTTVHINITSCPLGFILDKDKKKCVCVSVLNTHGAECNAKDRFIHRPSKWWVGYNMPNNSNISTDDSDKIVIKYCPYMYCIPHATEIAAYRHHIEQDSQCYFNRSGLLCGQCNSSLSVVFGTPRCIDCRYANTLVLIGMLCVFIIAGILLVAFLLAFNFTVTVGTINGFILYANMLQINQEIYFPLSSQTHPLYMFLRGFIAWLNLDIGTELCFFDGMTTFDKTYLQFIFPVYIWLIAGLLIWLSRKYRFFTGLMQNNGTKVLATLILLSYAKLSRAIAGSLASTHLGSGNIYWYYDASLPYIYGKHLCLFLTAVIFAVILLPYTFGLLFIKQLPRLTSLFIFRWLNKLKPLFDAYTGPYTDDYRFWVGFKLLIRILLLIFAATTTKTYNLLVVIGACSTLLSANYFYGSRVYKKRSVNIIEALLLLNLIIWSMTIFCLDTESTNDQVLVYIFAGTSFLGFCIVIFCYHIYTSTYFLRIREKIHKCFVRSSQEILKYKKRLKSFVARNWAEDREQHTLLRDSASIETGPNNSVQ